MPKVLLEDVQGSFVPDLTKVVTEAVGPGRTVTTIPGILSRTGKKNGNNRRYGQAVWEANLKPDSHLQQLISMGSAWGLLEHPKDGKVDLNSPISHRVVATRFSESDNTVIEGDIRILNTPEGDKLRALIEGGWNPTVSSRGFGTLLRAQDGVDEVQPDFVCEGWDIVSTPSFREAVLNPAAVQHESAPAAVAPVAAPAPQPVAPPSPVAVVPAPAPIQETAPVSNPQITNTVTMRSIIESLAVIAALDPRTLTPQRFSESTARLGELHQEAAVWGAEDPKRAWETTKLHTSIAEAETKFSAALSEPRRQATRLAENQTKLTSVLKAVTATALKYRTSLGESLKSVTKARKVTEEVARRGRGWQTRCEEAEAKVASLEGKFTLATESLDLLATKYKADTTELGKRVIQLEFPTQAATAPIAEALAKATHPSHIKAVRESISPAPKLDKNGKVIVESAPKLDANGKPIVESTPAQKPPAAVPPVQESAPATGIVLLAAKRGLPGSLTESVAMAQRLAAAGSPQ